MGTSNWIFFKYKTPHSCVEGRTVPYDFSVIVVHNTDPYTYSIMSSSEATRTYDGSNYIAWTPMPEFG